MLLTSAPPGHLTCPPRAPGSPLCPSLKAAGRNRRPRTFCTSLGRRLESCQWNLVESILTRRTWQCTGVQAWLRATAYWGCWLDAALHCPIRWSECSRQSFPGPCLQTAALRSEGLHMKQQIFLVSEAWCKKPGLVLWEPIKRVGGGVNCMRWPTFRHPSVHPVPGAQAVRAFAARRILSHLPHIICTWWCALHYLKPLLLENTLGYGLGGKDPMAYGGCWKSWRHRCVQSTVSLFWLKFVSTWCHCSLQGV